MNCHESVIGPRYFRSEQLVAVGDRILLDGVAGVVSAVFEPHSEEAVKRGCGQTGGVLFLMGGTRGQLELFGASGFLELDESGEGEDYRVYDEVS